MAKKETAKKKLTKKKSSKKKMSEKFEIPKILPPKSDIVFKMLLGDENNSDLLINLLELTLAKKIKSVTVLNPMLAPNSPEAKKSVLDIRAQLNSGELIDVEMQVENVKEMRERITFYNDKMLVGQLGDGEKYSKLKPAILIVITEESIVHESKKCHNKFMMLEVEEYFPFNDKKEIHILDMSRMNKETNKELSDWLAFFKAENEEEFMAVAQRNPVIGQAFNRLKRLSADEEAQMLYEARLKHQRDMWSREDAAEERGMQMGMQKGMYEAKLQTARKLRAKGMGVDEVAEITGLTVDDVLRL